MLEIFAPRLSNVTIKLSVSILILRGRIAVFLAESTLVESESVESAVESVASASCFESRGASSGVFPPKTTALPALRESSEGSVSPPLESFASLEMEDSALAFAVASSLFLSGDMTMDQTRRPRSRAPPIRVFLFIKSSF